MNNKWRLALIIPYALLLQSCAPLELTGIILALPGPSGAKQGYESETAIRSNDLISIQTIALLEIPEPPNYGRDTGYAPENAEYGGLSFGNTAQAFLNNYLEENGFEVIEYSPNRENEHRLIYDYSSLNIKGADAYLDVVPIEVEYKFWIGKMGPHVSTSFRLVSADSNEEIYAGSVQYGWKESRSAGIKIESPEDHEYESSEALKANKGEAVEWLVQGIEAVSLSIGRNIVGAKLADMAAPNTPFDLSGIYVSDITTNNHWVFTKAKDRRLEITFSQKGNEITGTNKSKNLKISGILKGDEISFFTWPSDISNDEIKGKWKINSGGFRLTGKWSHPLGGGKWNLTRVE